MAAMVASSAYVLQQHQQQRRVSRSIRPTSAPPLAKRRERSRSTAREGSNAGKARPEAVLTCDSVWDWLKPECEAFKGMAVMRQKKWDHVQHVFDQMQESGTLGEDESLTQTIEFSGCEGPDLERLDEQIDAAAQRLLRPLRCRGLPSDLAEQIKQDATETGSVIARLVPKADKLMIRVELMRENICQRWHIDNYVSRAIVSYNCSATEYVHDDFVDFDRFGKGWENEQVVSDIGAICSADVGGVLFMKGKLYPSPVNGLVHKAPEKLYYQNGSVATRLVLKIDVNRERDPCC